MRVRLIGSLKLWRLEVLRLLRYLGLAVRVLIVAKRDRLLLRLAIVCGIRLGHLALERLWVGRRK